MLRLSALIPAAASLTLAGCYCSHERGPLGARDSGIDDDAPDVRIIVDPPFDTGPPLDSGTRPDAGPDGDIVWIPRDTPDAELLLERCALREGQTPVFRVRVVTSACDEPGNTRWSIDAAARRITLEPFVWRPTGGPPCPPSTIEFVRDVTLFGASLAQGMWTVVLGSTVITLDVDPPLPELPCTGCRAPGETCAIDLECGGGRLCVPVRGDAACTSICAAPCQPFPGGTGASDLGCAERFGGAQTCEQDPNLGWLCETGTRDLCPPCEPGMGCRTDSDALSYCAWDRSPWDAGRYCDGDADCLPGVSCVEIAGDRSCRIRCRSDHPCPLGRCRPTELVCEIPKI